MKNKVWQIYFLCINFYFSSVNRSPALTSNHLLPGVDLFLPLAPLPTSCSAVSGSALRPSTATTASPALGSSSLLSWKRDGRWCHFSCCCCYCYCCCCCYWCSCCCGWGPGCGHSISGIPEFFVDALLPDSRKFCPIRVGHLAKACPLVIKMVANIAGSVGPQILALAIKFASFKHAFVGISIFVEILAISLFYPLIPATSVLVSICPGKSTITMFNIILIVSGILVPGWKQVGAHPVLFLLQKLALIC